MGSGKRGFGPVIRVDGCVASFILIGHQVISDVIGSFWPQFVPFSLDDMQLIHSLSVEQQQLARSEGCLWLLLALISNEVDPFTYIPYMQTLGPLLFETARPGCRSKLQQKLSPSLGDFPGELFVVVSCQSCQWLHLLSFLAFILGTAVGLCHKV